MHKEDIKAGKSPLGFVVLWIIGLYAFYILWGIGEILLEIKTLPIIKHLILWALTGWFGWIVISKFMIEYELAARNVEFTATKKLGRKSAVVASVKYDSIIALLGDDEKGEIAKYKPDKETNIKRAFQNGETMHIIYKFNSKYQLLTICASRQMIKTIREKKENINEAPDL